MNSGLEYPDNIKNLATRYRKIYDQMMATDRVRSNTKPANTKVTNTPIRFISPNMQIINRSIPLSPQAISSSTSAYYLRPENTFSPLTNEKRLRLMKEGRCFYC